MIPLSAILDVFLGLVITSLSVHPHIPKSLVLHGAEGKVTVGYQTVDFNANHLQELQPGFSWFMAFANLHSEVPLLCGGQELPAGHYKLNMLRGETDKDWQLEVMDFEFWQANSQAQRARRQGGDAAAAAAASLATLRAKLQAKGIPDRVVLDLQEFDADHAEHLDLSILLGGFATQGLFDATPTAGVQFVLRFSFGDIHKSLRFAEVFAK